MKESYKIGFALSGGFVRGFAHLGALQALSENGIKPDLIAGVSIGSVVGAFIADGRQPTEILELFMDKEFSYFTKFTRLPGGLMHLDKFREFIDANLSVKRIEELNLPLIISATNLDKGQSVHFSEGELAPRIAASCCVPGLFTPITIEGDHYVDGGVLMNLPVSIIRTKCEKVIAINLNKISTGKHYSMNLAGILHRTYHLMSHSNIIYDRRAADMLIEPDGLDEYSNTDLEKGREIFDIGYNTANKVIGQVKEIIFPA